jgi:thiosulfate reductase cytochrome b subunit
VRRVLLVWINLVWINVPLLLLTGLSCLSGLSALLALTVLSRLTALLVLPLAVLTALLFVHIVCHAYSSIVCRTHLDALLRDFIGIC